jgi:Flp pilus assembly protein TadD
MEVAMIRVIRFAALAALVLVLGLGPVGCGGETSAPKANKASEDAKMEGKKKMMEQKQKGGAGAAGGEADEKDKAEKDKAKDDKPKSGDKDK